VGVPLWRLDEAGPYQAIPQPGRAWQPCGQPAHRPHEYIRGGTAKPLTLLHPATGQLRASAVARTPNTLLHSWLMAEEDAILASLPPVADPTAPHRQPDAWIETSADGSVSSLPAALIGIELDKLPPVRLLLILDNLSGHHTPALVAWLVGRGVWPLYTPIADSWLNLAESVQRIIVRRALAGQHPTNAAQVMQWLTETVAGWNVDPTPFVCDGRRHARRQRARDRRHVLGGAAGYTRRPIRPSRARPSLATGTANGDHHDN
jgi:hypothetical protein